MRSPWRPPLIRGGQDSSQSPPCFRGMRGGSRYVQLHIKLVSLILSTDRVRDFPLVLVKSLKSIAELRFNLLLPQSRWFLHLCRHHWDLPHNLDRDRAAKSVLVLLGGYS